MENRTVFTGEELAEAVGVSAYVTAVELLTPILKILMEAHGRGHVTPEDLIHAKDALNDAGSKCDAKIVDRLAEVLQPTDPAPGPAVIDEILVHAKKQILAECSDILDRTRDAVDLEHKRPPAPDRKRKLP